MKEATSPGGRFFICWWLSAFSEDLLDFVGSQALAAARSDDGRVCDSLDGVIGKHDAHVGEAGRQSPAVMRYVPLLNSNVHAP